MADVATLFVRSLVVKDRTALTELFAPEVDFRGMTPGRFWEAGTPAEVGDVLLGHWLETEDVVEDVTALVSGRHVDRERVDYCMLVRSGQDLHLVEQRAYFDLNAEGRIAKMNLVCSGFRRVDEPAPAEEVVA